MIVFLKIKLNGSKEKFTECWSGLLLLVNPGCGVGVGVGDKWEEGRVGRGLV